MLVVPRKFPYRSSDLRMLLSGAIAGLAGWFAVHVAQTNDRGLSIDYIINFDVNGATIVWWLIAAICFVGVFFAILSMIIHRVSPKELLIDENEILIPCGFLLSKTQRIDFRELTNLSEVTMSRQTMLYLHTPYGKTALMASLLPEKEDYENIKQFLIRKLESARTSRM